MIQVQNHDGDTAPPLDARTFKVQIHNFLSMGYRRAIFSEDEMIDLISYEGLLLDNSSNHHTSYLIELLSLFRVVHIDTLKSVEIDYSSLTNPLTHSINYSPVVSS